MGDIIALVLPRCCSVPSYSLWDHFILMFSVSSYHIVVIVFVKDFRKPNFFGFIDIKCILKIQRLPRILFDTQWDTIIEVLQILNYLYQILKCFHIDLIVNFFCIFILATPNFWYFPIHILKRPLEANLSASSEIIHIHIS